MPLAFESESHGTITFGFFNIESDMLILDRHFFFASDFCLTICELIKEGEETTSGISLKGYMIETPAEIGDLHGGISGTHYSGFIGESYKRYPFPKSSVDFKQQTSGFKTRSVFEQMMQSFGSHYDLILELDNQKKQVKIGPYLFTQQNFSHLIQYVINGGYPGWSGDIAPDYVIKMDKNCTQII